MPSRCQCTATEGICKSRQAHSPYEKGHRVGCAHTVSTSTNPICLECRTGGDRDWHTRPSKARRTQLSAEPAVATNATGEPAVANGLSQTPERDRDETLNCGGTASAAEARHKKETSQQLAKLEEKKKELLLQIGSVKKEEKALMIEIASDVVHGSINAGESDFADMDILLQDTQERTTGLVITPGEEEHEEQQEVVSFFGREDVDGP